MNKFNSINQVFRRKWGPRHFIPPSLHFSGHFIPKGKIVTSYQSLHTKSLHTKRYFIPVTSYQALSYRSHFIPVTSYRIISYQPLHTSHFIPKSLHTSHFIPKSLHTEVTSYHYYCGSISSEMITMAHFFENLTQLFLFYLWVLGMDQPHGEPGATVKKFKRSIIFKEARKKFQKNKNQGRFPFLRVNF